ncbi:hypothetical protein QUF88_17050 [Bacillus sp. DX1.1]|uniref:hypothetical protein n=1 Tax=unclassified Bacillus (in: firmicutes) TaxID=185979 RepID=UPI0025705DFD|nr:MULTISPECIES: hypothetical protein [unclassified Bacillus (in: firmicutes)]MDM5155449.1 hypothetical protein [Bacillus sp. DX1.1]WJE79762.1 hypothetical protein QRE67_14575 [Bacillus sp. DX3.1]
MYGLYLQLPIYNQTFSTLAKQIPLASIPNILDELTSIQYKIKQSIHAATLIEVALVKILKQEQQVMEFSTNTLTFVYEKRKEIKNLGLDLLSSAVVNNKKKK